MAVSENTVLTKLYARLDRFAERVSELRQSLKGPDADIDNQIAGFVERHDAIRSMLDETTEASALRLVEDEAFTLESALETWIKETDHKFRHPGPRVDSVSM